jgi:hypothetical protein
MDEYFKDLESKVYELIGRTSKKEVGKLLGIDFRSLEKRLQNGVWKKSEIEIINKEHEKINT